MISRKNTLTIRCRYPFSILSWFFVESARPKAPSLTTVPLDFLGSDPQCPSKAHSRHISDTMKLIHKIRHPKKL